MSGMSASVLTALRTRLEAACISGEFLPVTMRPILQLDGRAAEETVAAFALGLRLARRVVRGWHHHAIEPG